MKTSYTLSTSVVTVRESTGRKGMLSPLRGSVEGPIPEAGNL